LDPPDELPELLERFLDPPEELPELLERFLDPPEELPEEPPDRLDKLRCPDWLELDEPCDSSSESPPLPISFFATAAAAGTATPSAAPATTFFVVDVPPSSAWFSASPITHHPFLTHASVSSRSRR